MTLSYLELAIAYAVALILYWEVLEIKGDVYGRFMVALYVLPAVQMPILAVGYIFWFSKCKTHRKRFKMPIDRGILFLTLAFYASIYHLWS